MFDVVGEKMVVKPLEIEQTESGIIIPESAKKNPFIGTVIKIGNKIPEQFQEICVGDKVWWIPNAGSYFEYDDKGFIVISPEHIIGYEHPASIINENNK